MATRWNQRELKEALVDLLDDFASRYAEQKK